MRDIWWWWCRWCGGGGGGDGGVGGVGEGGGEQVGGGTTTEGDVLYSDAGILAKPAQQGSILSIDVILGLSCSTINTTNLSGLKIAYIQSRVYLSIKTSC